jgi:hypothetical protein
MASYRTLLDVVDGVIFEQVGGVWKGSGGGLRA